MSVNTGDVWQLGRHRLMCGDATDKAAVGALFDGRKPTLVVTSPPYANQRDYDRPIACWDSMMCGALDGHAFSGDVQILVNLGPIHFKGEWWSYWSNWLEQMKEKKWKVFSQYIWDKTSALAGDFHGRLGPSHEYIWHINKMSPKVQKTIPCKLSGSRPGRYGVRNKKGQRTQYNAARIVQSHKIMDSVIRMPPDRSNRTGHPAVYPKQLPAALIKSYKCEHGLVYDPFLGSGTTLLACELENIDGLGMEISSAYCQIVIERWNKNFPKQQARLVV